MRLYLSSQRLGTAPGELVSLLDGRTRIAVIANAADDVPPTKRRGRVEREMADLREIGLDPSEIDLRDHFGELDQARSTLEDFDAVWVLGGNVVVAGGTPVADHYIDNHVPFIALRDGQALVINGAIRSVVE